MGSEQGDLTELFCNSSDFLFGMPQVVVLPKAKRKWPFPAAELVKEELVFYLGLAAVEKDRVPDSSSS